LSPRRSRKGERWLSTRFQSGLRLSVAATLRSGAIWISKHCDLFGSEKKSLVCRIIANVSGSSLGTEPFTKLSLMKIGLLGELLRGRWANIGKRRVNSKLVTKYDERSVYCRPEIIDPLLEKLIEGIGVQLGFVGACRRFTSSCCFHLYFPLLRLRPMALTGSSCRVHLWPYALMHYSGFRVPGSSEFGCFLLARA
jgi:hypothetical protein